MTIKTVLQYVQGALNIMDSDAVDSITDTEEAGQIALLLQDCYDELIHRQEWDFLNGPVTLSAAVDPTDPTKFVIGEDVGYVKQLWYNIATDGTVNRRKLVYVDPEEFLQRYSNGLPSPNRTLVTIEANGGQIQFYVRNDQPPTHYTSFDDASLHMDSYDSGVETTLVSSKITSYGLTNPQFTIADDFVPMLPEHMVPLMTHTLNAAASITFKQQESAPDEKRVNRQIASARRKESRTTRNHYYANAFGRRSYTSSSERLLNNSLRQGS